MKKRNYLFLFIIVGIFSIIACEKDKDQEEFEKDIEITDTIDTAFVDTMVIDTIIPEIPGDSVLTDTTIQIDSIPVDTIVDPIDTIIPDPIVDPIIPVPIIPTIEYIDISTFEVIDVTEYKDGGTQNYSYTNETFGPAAASTFFNSNKTYILPVKTSDGNYYISEILFNNEDNMVKDNFYISINTTKYNGSGISEISIESTPTLISSIPVVQDPYEVKVNDSTFKRITHTITTNTYEIITTNSITNLPTEYSNTGPREYFINTIAAESDKLMLFTDLNDFDNTENYIKFNNITSDNNVVKIDLAPNASGRGVMSNLILIEKEYAKTLCGADDTNLASKLLPYIKSNSYEVNDLGTTSTTGERFIWDFVHTEVLTR